MTIALNPHISIASPFGVADLPTLCVWRNRLHRMAGEAEEELDQFMDAHFARTDVLTWAAYRDEELGGYFEAATGELSFATDGSVAAVARIEMTFKREFFKRRPEAENGAGVGGQGTTQPALNLVLRELFDGDYDLVFFPLAKGNRPIAMLVMSVGAAAVGPVDGTMNLYVLSKAEWERTNAAFIAEWQASQPVLVPETEATEETYA
jgi:hypothetical protein